MDKPFVFGVAVEADHFVGRDVEIARLSNNFKYGVNTILMAPRRLGKTSLVRRVASEVENESIVIVQMDIFSCRSEYDFLNMFASALIQKTSSKFEEIQQNVSEFLSRLVPKVNFAPDPAQEISLMLGITQKTHKPEEVLNLPEVIAQKKGVHIIVCIDEFQQVGDFPDSLAVQKRMRSVWQLQKNVSYCLYGSRKNMMRSLFQMSSKPFYKFGTIMELGVIPTMEWVPYLCNRFRRMGKELSKELAVAICERVEGHSSYVQQLAYNTLLCSVGDVVTQDNLNDAFENLLDENTSFFSDRTQNLTSYQMNFIKALLDGVHTDFGRAEVRDNYNLGAPSNIARIKEALLTKEIVEINNRMVYLSDPVMAAWLKMRVLFA